MVKGAQEKRCGWVDTSSTEVCTSQKFGSTRAAGQAERAQRPMGRTVGRAEDQNAHQMVADPSQREIGLKENTQKRIESQANWRSTGVGVVLAVQRAGRLVAAHPPQGAGGGGSSGGVCRSS
jgi:hypothetical protein